MGINPSRFLHSLRSVEMTSEIPSLRSESHPLELQKEVKVVFRP